MKIFFLVAIVIAFYFMLQERKKVTNEQISEDTLQQPIRTWVWIICFFNPLWGGAIFYYGWKKKMPLMAKEANRISWKVLLIQIVLGIAFLVLISQQQANLSSGTMQTDSPSLNTSEQQVSVDSEPEADKGVVEIKSSDKENISNSWYWHYDENGFSLLVPDSYSVRPVTNGIKILKEDGTSDFGYTIFYKNGVVDSSGVESFAKDVYGKDCEVSLEQDEDSIYDYDEYYVQRGNDGGECRAYKVTMRYVPYLERALTWHGGQEPIMPVSDNAYGNWYSGESLNDNFYDYTMLNTITFEFE